MRHTKISTTMEVYAQAGMEKKRVARWKAVDALFDRRQRHRRGNLAANRCCLVQSFNVSQDLNHRVVPVR
jgi:hypothetical protein